MDNKYDSYIIHGYKGIMDLDLTNVDKKHHKIMIDQHFEDIKIYKREQSERPKKLQYENTIMHAEKIHSLDSNALLKRSNENMKIQREEDENRTRLYYKYCSK